MKGRLPYLFEVFLRNVFGVNESPADPDSIQPIKPDVSNEVRLHPNLLMLETAIRRGENMHMNRKESPWGGCANRDDQHQPAINVPRGDDDDAPRFHHLGGNIASKITRPNLPRRRDNSMR